MGPLISGEQRARVEEVVADAVAAGAELAAGGGRPDVALPGWFYEPTILLGEPAGARIATEEIFGPVVTVARIANVEDGIRRANASTYGLGASVWTRDRTKARLVAARLEAGSVWTNDVAYSYGSCQAPWGGRKESGFGRTHSRHGLRELSHLKFTDADSGRVTPPWWFPYDERASRRLSRRRRRALRPRPGAQGAGGLAAPRRSRHARPTRLRTGPGRR